MFCGPGLEGLWRNLDAKLRKIWGKTNKETVIAWQQSSGDVTVWGGPAHPSTSNLNSFLPSFLLASCLFFLSLGFLKDSVKWNCPKCHFRCQKSSKDDNRPWKLGSCDFQAHVFPVPLIALSATVNWIKVSILRSALSWLDHKQINEHVNPPLLMFPHSTPTLSSLLGASSLSTLCPVLHHKISCEAALCCRTRSRRGGCLRALRTALLLPITVPTLFWCTQPLRTPRWHGHQLQHPTAESLNDLIGRAKSLLIAGGCVPSPTSLGAQDPVNTAQKSAHTSHYFVVNICPLPANGQGQERERSALGRAWRCSPCGRIRYSFAGFSSWDNLWKDWGCGNNNLIYPLKLSLLISANDRFTGEKKKYFIWV